mgnify:FL=1
MKKIIILCLIILSIVSISIVALLHYFSYPERTKRATTALDESQKFSQSEVEAAAKCVYDYFLNKDDMYLKKLWYDEESSTLDVKSYMTAGKGLTNGVDESNVIVLYTDHHAGQNYNKYVWILIRDNKTDDWRIDDSGPI